MVQLLALWSTLGLLNNCLNAYELLPDAGTSYSWVDGMFPNFLKRTRQPDIPRLQKVLLFVRLWLQFIWSSRWRTNTTVTIIACKRYTTLQRSSSIWTIICYWNIQVGLLARQRTIVSSHHTISIDVWELLLLHLTKLPYHIILFMFRFVWAIIL